LLSHAISIFTDLRLAITGVVVFTAQHQLGLDTYAGCL